MNVNANNSPSTKRTGVDVFQEEQRREEQSEFSMRFMTIVYVCSVLIKTIHTVRTLEERLAHLEKSFQDMEKKASMDLFEDLQQQQVNG